MIRFGLQRFLKQDFGIPQGSPGSVFTANMTPVYLEKQNWDATFLRIITHTNNCILRTMRMRWVDDILTVFASRDKLTKLQRDNVEQDISAEKAVVFH